jgi:hypothetical protein
MAQLKLCPFKAKPILSEAGAYRRPSRGIYAFCFSHNKGVERSDRNEARHVSEGVRHTLRNKCREEMDPIVLRTL